MEIHLLLLNYSIAFFFPIQLPWCLAWEYITNFNVFWLFLKKYLRFLDISIEWRLIWVNKWVKDSFGSWNCISNDNNTSNVLWLYCMIYPASDRKKFSFHRYYIYSIVNKFGNDFIFPIYKWILDDIVQSVTMRSQCVRILLIYQKKRKMIWKSIY